MIHLKRIAAGLMIVIVPALFGLVMAGILGIIWLNANHLWVALPVDVLFGIGMLYWVGMDFRDER